MPTVNAPVPCIVAVKVALSLLGAVKFKLLKKAAPLNLMSPETLEVITIVTEVPADDTYISNLLSMAIDACGQYLGYSVRKASVQYGFDSLVGQPAIMNPVNGTEQPVGNLLRIPSRVISLTSVQYVDDNNTAQAFTDYIVSPQPLGTYGRTIFITSAPSSTTDDVTKYLVRLPLQTQS